MIKNSSHANKEIKIQISKSNGIIFIRIMFMSLSLIMDKRNND